MNIRQGVGSRDYKRYETDELRANFLIDNVFGCERISFTYSHVDRIIVGGVAPSVRGVCLAETDWMRSKYFLERREMGVINIGGNGIVETDGKKYHVNAYDCLYIGKGTQQITFFSCDEAEPALFYINSCPAHKAFSTTLCTLEGSIKVSLGSAEECNRRTIHKYILPEGVQSCQLVMGLTILERGSVWNTMPTHTHERRMEVYLYFNMPRDNVVFHLMGEPGDTRHIVVRDKQAVISPSYSIHSGVGTSNYSFIWGMCGENQAFDDMDAVAMKELK